MNKKGFSLLELIVSMSIITTLTGLFLANYHSTNQRTDLTMAAQTMVADIRYTQANALGLIKYDGDVPSGGWGVYFSTDTQDSGKYVIFADENDDETYQASEATVNLGGRHMVLPPKIKIDSVRLDSADRSSAVVTFLPPDPVTRLKSGTATGTVLEVRLKEGVNNTTKTIRINFLGLVEVID